MSDVTVALDAGHGGSDPGAKYMNRQEKDEALALTKAVGNILQDRGVNVFYTRTTDEYETPFKKATDANRAGADLFVSVHRNSSEYPNQYSGIQSLVYRDSGVAAQLARNINQQLENLGFNNIGVSERPNLVVLRRTQMPAVLVEVGFINTDADNEIFDNNFDKIAEAIADGIMQTIYSGTKKTSVDASDEDINTDALTDAQTNFSIIEGSKVSSDSSSFDDISNYTRQKNTFDTLSRQDISYDTNSSDSYEEKLYRVQVGAYKNKENADRILNSLLIEGFPAFIIYDDGYYKIQVGAFRFLANAIKMEERLRQFRYNTYIVYD